MEIQINFIPLCTIAASSMPDVYKVFGEHSLAFHLDQDNERINIVSPVQGIQVVIENGSQGSATSLLDKVRSVLQQAGFSVYFVNNEDERKRCLAQLNEEKQRIWISILQGEPQGDGVTAYFSFHHMKSSKQLAQLLLQNIAKMTELPVNGVLFEWKNIMNSIFPLSGPLQQMPTIGVDLNNLAAFSERQIERLSKSMIRTIFSFFNQQDLLEVIQYVLAQSVSRRDAPKMPVVEDFAPEFEYTPVFNQEPEKEQQDHELEQDQVPAHIPQPPQLSTFSWLYMNMVKKDAQSAGSNTRTTTSFITYMNKLGQAKNPKTEKNEQQHVNLLVLNRDKSHEP